MTKPLVLEGVIDPKEDVTREDGGKAFIAELPLDCDGVCVTLRSYEEDAEYPYPEYTEADTLKGHTRLREFVGKKVRITVEVVE